MITRSALALALALALPGVAMAQGKKSPQTEEASSRFSRGVGLYREGDYRAALIEFKRAYELSPNYKVLYNLGQTSQELQDYATALRAFEQYLQAGGKDVDSKRRAQVEEDIAKLKTRVAKISVDVNVEGAEISVDDVVVGKSPLPEAVVVSAGRRKVGVAKPGMAPASRVVDLAGGDDQRVALELVEPTPTAVVPTPAPTTPTPATAPPPAAPVQGREVEPVPRRNMTPAWVSLTVTGVLAAGTGVFGALALVSKGSFDDKIGTLGASAQSIDDARSQTRTFALVTDVVGATAIAAGAITLVLALTARPAARKEATGLLVLPGSIAGTF